MAQVLQLVMVLAALQAAHVSGFRNKAVSKGLVQAREVSESSVACRLNDSIECPEWLCKTILGSFFDVKLFCKFPSEDFVLEKIHEQERQVLKQSGTAILQPGMAKLELRELRSNATAKDLDADGSNVDGDPLSMLMVPHIDDCAQEGTVTPAQSGLQIYENIKAVVDTFDIYSRCTKAYVTRTDPHSGIPKMQKDDIIAISTEMAAGFFSLSFEDVTQYSEYTDQDGTKTLTAIISSRRENVIEGNYDVVVQLFKDGHVQIDYTKRQNLVPWLLKNGVSSNGYKIMTQQSVDATIRKLAYAGLYGSTVFEHGGCYKHESCSDYETLDIGDTCAYDMECKSHLCDKVSPLCFWWGCDRVCAAAK